MHDWKWRIRSAFIAAGHPLDEDIVEELAQHAEASFEALRADGATPREAEARTDALLQAWCTEPDALRRRPRRPAAVITPPAASRTFALGAIADAIYGLRLLKSNPGSAAMTVLTVALGVGAVTTLFSVAYGVLLRPLPWADTDRLVRVMETRGGREGRVPGTLFNGSYLAWAEAPQTIESIGAFRETTMTLTSHGDAVRTPVSAVTPSMLELLRARPVIGRLFESSEGRQGQPAVALLSTGLWEERFAARPDIVGQTMMLDGTQHTIVGVMPRAFRFPTGETRAWTAWQIPAVDGPNGIKAGVIFRALARLKPGVPPAQAAAEGTARAVSAAADAGPVGMALFGAREPIQISVRDAREAATAEVRPAIVILLIASALLFVTAIANVGNMQLARTTARHRELTIRAALGAGAGRLGRQLLIENAIIALLGSMGGLLLAVGLHAALPSLLPAGFPRADAIVIDGRVLAVAMVLAAFTTIAAGVLPLLHARRLDLARALADGSAASTGYGRSRIAIVRPLIVASQVAVTCVLLIGAGLLARSFRAQMAADRGYDPANVLTATIPFPSNYTVDRRARAGERIVERMRQRPGVTHAATSTALPLASSGGFQSFNFASPLRGGANVDVETIRRVVSPEYFGALGIRVRAGRPLTAADTMTAPVAIVVNRSFVQKFLDDISIEQAIGFSLGTAAVRYNDQRRDATIVGVTDDMKQDAADGPPQPEMFVATTQVEGLNVGAQAFVVIRTADDPVRHVEMLRSVLREEDPVLALDAVMTMDQRVGASVSRPRAYAVLFAGFAACALLIAGAGLFGVLSHSVIQRSREIAVRTALGATRRDVVRTVLAQMAAATVGGVAIGLLLAFGLAQNVSAFVYGISTHDQVSFVAGPLLLLIAGAIACIVPARRVANTDPLQVLRDGR